MLKKLLVKKNERGLLLREGDFEGLLPPGAAAKPSATNLRMPESAAVAVCGLVTPRLGYALAVVRGDLYWPKPSDSNVSAN